MQPLLQRSWIFTIFVTILFNITLLLTIVQSENINGEGKKDEIVCDTLQGKLLGSVLKSRGGRDFYSFSAIPYAEKPERFQLSKPGVTWEGVKNAKEYGSTCAQFFGNPAVYSGSEDCLFINVHTPSINADAKLNVMVWIHGGGFQFGAGSEYNPEYFMDENVVLVTFNYRLGILGFLSTGDDIVPGNNGMKDQVLALQWVKKHISSFGGSPDKVTIFGQSAGGSKLSVITLHIAKIKGEVLYRIYRAAVNFHLLSEQSKDLFQNAIAMSGSSLNPFANQLNAPLNVQKLGKKINCDGNIQEIVDCVKGKSLESILQAQSSFLEWFFFPMCTWSVVVEAKSNKNGFLTDTPFNLMKAGSFHEVPYVTGITSDEGVYQTAGILFNDVLKNEFNKEFKRYAPIALNYDDAKTKDWKDWISDDLLQYYAKRKPLEMSTWKNYMEMFGDRSINNGVISAANLLAKHTKVYPYVFSYQGDSSLINTLLNVPGVHGVAHADDLMYLFKDFYGLPSVHTNTKDGDISVHFIKSLVEFAATGVAKPWGEARMWNAINPNEKYNVWYSINTETGLEELDEKIESRMKLWGSLLPEDEVAASLLKDKRSTKTEL